MQHKNFFNTKTLINILNKSSEGFLILDKEYKILFAFDEALKILDKKSIEKDENLKNFICKDDILLSNNKSIVTEVKTGCNIYKPVFLTIFNDNDDHYIARIQTNITSEKQPKIIENIENTNKETLLKFAFLGSLSHDIRGTLHSIYGFSQALFDGIAGDLTNTQVKYLSIITKNTNQLNRILNNIITYSKIEAQAIELKFDNFDISDCFSNLKTFFAEVAGNKELHLEINNKLEYITIYSDKERIEQAITNILESSIIFTPEGTIKLNLCQPEYNCLKKIMGTSIPLRPDEYILITIEDPGKGIEPQEADNLFELTSVNKKNKTRKYGISGLSLIVAKKIVRKLGGNIIFDLTDDFNALFYIVLPLNSNL